MPTCYCQAWWGRAGQATAPRFPQNWSHSVPIVECFRSLEMGGQWEAVEAGATGPAGFPPYVATQGLPRALGHRKPGAVAGLSPGPPDQLSQERAQHLQQPLSKHGCCFGGPGPECERFEGDFSAPRTPVSPSLSPNILLVPLSEPFLRIPLGGWEGKGVMEHPE